MGQKQLNKQRFRKHIGTGLLVAALAAFALAAACTSAASATDQPIPAGTTLVGRIDLAAILADDTVDDLIAALPSSADEVVAMVLDEPGIDLQQITDFLLFATGPETNEFGLIVSGTLDLDELVAAIEASQGSQATVETVFGKAVYTFPEDSDEALSLAALSDGRLVAGSLEAVRGSVAVDDGEEPAASGDLLARLDGLGTPWISLVADVSAGDADKLLGDDGPVGAFGGELPIDLSAFEDLRTLTLIIDKRGDDFIAEAEIGFTSEDSAGRAAEMIDGFTSLFKAFAPDPALVSFLDGLQIETAGTEVSIDFKISTDDAVDLVGNLLTVFSESEEVEFDLPDLNLN